ncbi:MAG: YbjN domain-containing protein [Clostridia bacterium]|nr:YbjN domain-containing protein [Clostridia bacterium]
MATEKQVKQAQQTYETICAMLDEMGWSYDKKDEERVIYTGVKSNDLPISFMIVTDTERSLVSLISKLPFTVPEDKRTEVSLGVSIVNYLLVDGSFDYNFLEGTTYFRMTSSFKDSMLSKEVFEYMVYVSCNTIDDYNEKLFLLSENQLTLEEFLKLFNN